MRDSAQQTLGDAQAFYNDLIVANPSSRRDPNTIKDPPGYPCPCSAALSTKRRRGKAELESHIVHEHAQRMLSGLLRVPVEQTRPRQPVAGQSAGRERDRGTFKEPLLASSWRWADGEKLTIRQIIGRLGGGRGISRSPAHPKQVANTIEEWFTNGARRRIQYHAATAAVGLELFVEHVVADSRVLAGSFATSTPDGPCEITTVCRDRSTSTAAISAKSLSRYESFLRVRTRRHLNGRSPARSTDALQRSTNGSTTNPRVHRSVVARKAQQIAGPKLRGAYGVTLIDQEVKLEVEPLSDEIDRHREIHGVNLENSTT